MQLPWRQSAPFLNSQNVQTSNISVDLRAIDNSLQDLKNASYQSAYSKQKCSLHTELEKFLASLPNSKTILPASPTDINCFLAWKDLHGKTVVHSDGCSDFHLQSTAKCKCAKCLGCRNLMANPPLTSLKELNFLWLILRWPGMTTMSHPYIVRRFVRSSEIQMFFSSIK